MGNAVISVDPNPYNHALLFNSLGITVDEMCLLYTCNKDAAIFTTSRFTVDVLLAKRTFYRHLYIKNSGVTTHPTLSFSHPIKTLICQEYIQKCYLDSLHPYIFTLQRLYLRFN